MKCPQMMWCEHRQEIKNGDDEEAKIQQESICQENWKKCPDWDRLTICGEHGWC